MKQFGPCWPLAHTCQDKKGVRHVCNCVLNTNIIAYRTEGVQSGGGTLYSARESSVWSTIQPETGERELLTY